jgi:hypothetical protein
MDTGRGQLLLPTPDNRGRIATTRSGQTRVTANRFYLIECAGALEKNARNKAWIFDIRAISKDTTVFKAVYTMDRIESVVRIR